MTTLASRDILKIIEEATGDGTTATGHDLFPSSLVPHVEHLHRTYNYESVVRYLMTLRPPDAGWLESETGVEP